MKKNTWIFWFGAGLIVLSVVLYFIHYFIFRDLHHILIFFFEDIAFIPIEVLLVSLIIHRIIERREKAHVLEKVNMLIGVFFSEVGVKLINILMKADIKKKKICNAFCDEEYSKYEETFDLVQDHAYVIDINRIDIEGLAVFLKSKRTFLLGLLQNPSLLEHDAFTELLRAVFHLEDELHHYINYNQISGDLLEHLKVDIERVYPLIIKEWIAYMKYLKASYPYLYSINERYNPFKETEDALKNEL